MHEASLARNLLAAALSEAAANQARRIVRVRGWVAESEALSRESLRLHFKHAAEGTIAADADLALELTHVQARCDDCGEVFAPDHHLLLCPRCGATRARLLGRIGVGIDALEIE